MFHEHKHLETEHGKCASASASEIWVWREVQNKNGETKNDKQVQLVSGPRIWDMGLFSLRGFLKAHTCPKLKRNLGKPANNPKTKSQIHREVVPGSGDGLSFRPFLQAARVAFFRFRPASEYCMLTDSKQHAFGKDILCSPILFQTCA